MNLLQVFFIISWVIIFILAIDIARRKKFNALHFAVFLLVWVGLLVFTFSPEILNAIWKVFWVQRWADVLVYTSIIFLLYFVLLLLKKIETNKEYITTIIREIAINNSIKKVLKWKYVFVIPAYNEWKVIYENIENILKNGYENIIVVNDWSKDNTLTELQKFWEKIILLTHFINRWQWAALETWFEYVRRYSEIDYVITFDADWQHDLNDIKTFENVLKKNSDVDILLWSRFIWNVKTNIPLTRKIVLKLGIFFTFFLSNIKLSDTHNGYRMIKRSALDKIKIIIDGMWHASEILDYISKYNLKFIEVPVNIKYSDYSLNKWQHSWNALNIAIKMIWNKFFM